MANFSGDNGPNTFTGTSTDDVIDGAGGNDTLNGAGGNDLIIGGSGTDILTGGTGADSFRDTAANFNGDHITDFLIGDRIQFTDLTAATANIHIEGSDLVYNGGLIHIDNLGPGRLVLRAITGGGVEVRLQSPAHNDFNGDGFSDILWRHDNGLVIDWLSNGDGNFRGNDTLATQVPTDWHVVGTGDFDGNGRVDALWRNNDGLVTAWLGQESGAFLGTNSFTQVPTDRHVVGTGDFNGDGVADVLWRHNDGTVTGWIGVGDGSFTTNNNLVTQVPTDWHIVGTGDFNGDGLDDVLWRNNGGLVTDWLGQTNGAFIGNTDKFLTQVDNTWHIVGTGDFNGDGRSDVLWRHDNGLVTNWLGLEDGTFVGNTDHSLNQLATSWHVVQTGDFNGDAIDDILWRNDDGTVTDWLGAADGGFVPNNGLHTLIDNGWHVQPQDTFL